MLHVGVLPHHVAGRHLHNLRYIVVDEAHVYRGVFGSHVGNVLRRLRRLAQVYDAEPQLLLASATIANPGELAESIAGIKATVVDDDAAPRAERTILLWNPELLDAELGLRASALGDASKLMADLVSRGLRTICFAKSRKAAELIHRFTVQRVDTETAKRLAPYRAGYTPAQRREIERRLVAGELLGVAATTPSSSASTSPVGLRDLGRVSGKSRHCGSSGDARGGAGTAWRCSLQARTRSTSTSSASRNPAAAARRGGDPRPREPARTRRARQGCRVEAPLDDDDRATLGTRRSSALQCCPTSS